VTSKKRIFWILHSSLIELFITYDSCKTAVSYLPSKQASTDKLTQKWSRCILSAVILPNYFPKIIANERTNERMNERTNKQTNERTNEQMNKQTNTCLKGQIKNYTSDDPWLLDMVTSTLLMPLTLVHVIAWRSGITVVAFHFRSQNLMHFFHLK